MQDNFQMTATTLFGLEEVLAREILQLGGQKVKPGNRSVSFVGDKGFMYKANLSLRTAIRILKPIQKFKVGNEEELYQNIKIIPWEQYLTPKHTLAIHAVVHSKDFTDNSYYIALKSKDAIVDYFREKTGERPSIDIKHPDLSIHVYIHQNSCTISLDSSGDSLHKRGYRERTNIAPINEVLAAGLVLLSSYDGSTHFLDPMCGSGTLLIEAAMVACNIPANINRPEFGFEKWPDYDNALFERIHDAMLKRIKGPRLSITGYDKAPSAVEKAKENVKNANLSEFIQIKRTNFFHTEKQVEGPMTILFNPPYGERLKIDLSSFYKNIGDTLKQHYPQTQAWLITSNMEAIKNVGLHTSRKIALKNAHLDSKLVCYDIYKGSKKISKLQRPKTSDQ